MKRDDFFYYDYAGGTYYAVKLCWFFDCPEDLEELVWTNGVKIVWHIHGSYDCNGEWDDHAGYHAEIPFTEELRDYFQQQRYWQDQYRECKSIDERRAVNKRFKECV